MFIQIVIWLKDMQQLVSKERTDNSVKTITEQTIYLMMLQEYANRGHPKAAESRQQIMQLAFELSLFMENELQNKYSQFSECVNNHTKLFYSYFEVIDAFHIPSQEINSLTTR